ncbi:MAG: site-specific integrase [Pseudomonadota bacterium]
MATIQARKNAKGITRYTAQIRIKRKGVVVHQESRTFPRYAQAEAWAKRREVELAEPGAVNIAKFGNVSIGALIQRYIDEFEETAQWQRSKATSLRALIKKPIAQISAVELTTERLVQHVKERRAEGVAPSTAANDLTWLGVVLRSARAAWGIPAAADEVAKAQTLLRNLRLIGRPKQRDRTPTYEELQALDAYFERQDRRRNTEIPMRRMMWFAIYSTRREAEICRLMWEDNDPERLLGIVRDAKHPRQKIGNNRAFRYTPQAWAIMQMQPRSSDDGRIFPYDSKTVSARFTRACHVLGIEDLHFHDLRHEGTTRLFERGLTIPEVAAHTLHESWAMLKRYTHIVKRGRVLDAPFLPPDLVPTPAVRPHAANPDAQQDQPTK